MAGLGTAAQSPTGDEDMNLDLFLLILVTALMCVMLLVPVGG